MIDKIHLDHFIHVQTITDLGTGDLKLLFPLEERGFI